MPWSRLDDSLDDHRKIQAISNDALAVWACALTFSNRKRTDGFLTPADVRRLLGLRQAPESAVDELLAVPAGFDFGLWEKRSGGYQIHDYEKYNKTRARMEKEAEEARERMEQLRQNGRQSGSDPPESSRELRSELQTVPVPGTRYPDPDASAPALAGADAPKQARGKPSDEERQMWHALATALGHAPNGRNAVERGPWNVAIKGLLNGGATPDQIPGLVRRFRAIWPDAEWTPMALAKHLSLLMAAPTEAPSIYDSPLFNGGYTAPELTAAEVNLRPEMQALAAKLTGKLVSIQDEKAAKAALAEMAKKMGRPPPPGPPT